MSGWPESLTLVIVELPEGTTLSTGVLSCVHHFSVPMRSGSTRHLVLTSSESREVEGWISSLGHKPRIVGAYKAMDTSLPKPPAGKRSKGLLIGLTDSRSTEEYEAFNRWYDGTHAADVLASGFYWSAARFRRVDSDAQGIPEFLAMYESENPGGESLRALMKHYESHPSPGDEICLVRHVWAFDRQSL